MRIILHHSFKQQNPDNLQPSTNEFDGCYHVFLDVGSNLGNTVRLSIQFQFLILVTVFSGYQMIYTVTEKMVNIPKTCTMEIQPRMLCNGNGAISHLQTEMGFFEDFRYSLCN